MLRLYVHRDCTNYLGTGQARADQDVRLDFHTAPDLWHSVHDDGYVGLHVLRCRADIIIRDKSVRRRDLASYTDGTRTDRPVGFWEESVLRMDRKYQFCLFVCCFCEVMELGVIDYLGGGVIDYFFSFLFYSLSVFPISPAWFTWY